MMDPRSLSIDEDILPNLKSLGLEWEQCQNTVGVRGMSYMTSGREQRKAVSSDTCEWMGNRCIGMRK